MWAELLTHRALSRNAASSRATPVSYFIQQVKEDPYIPADLPDGVWCGNGKGMVATEPLDDGTAVVAHDEIHRLRSCTVRTVELLESMGIHKQDANRYLEPFQWIRGVITATDWDNFFALRTDHRAYPPFRFLARCMYVAYQRSVPKESLLHLPFITDEDREAACLDEASQRPEWFPQVARHFDDISSVEVFNLMAWSAARCARVSVKNFRTDDTDRVKDMETFLKLTTDTPRHASPLEHQAFVDRDMPSHWKSNFRSPWVQFRKLLPDESISNFRPTTTEVAEWNVPDDVFGGVPGVDW
jgi:hypothetical protein